MIPLGEQLADVYRLIHRSLVRRLAKETPRPWAQLKLLRVLAGGDVPTQAVLADRLMMDAPSVSRLVVRLESEGLLFRREGDDRRCLRLTLTDAARPELEATLRSIGELEGQIERLLTEDERRTLQTLLEKLHEGFRSEGAPSTHVPDP